MMVDVVMTVDVVEMLILTKMVMTAVARILMVVVMMTVAVILEMVMMMMLVVVAVMIRDLKDTEVLGQNGGELGRGVLQSLLVELQGFLYTPPQDHHQLQQTRHDRRVLHRQHVLQHLLTHIKHLITFLHTSFSPK